MTRRFLHLARAIFGLVLLTHPRPLQAQFGSPLEVTFRQLPKGDDGFPMKGFQWKTEAGMWVAEFDEIQDDAKGKGPFPSIRITDPSGTTSLVAQDSSARPAIWDDLTGSFSNPPKWTEPWICPWPGSGREVFLGEQSTPGPWQVFRILWHVGGLSGPPPLPFVLVVRHRESGHWAAFAAALEYPPTPARGDVMSVAVEGEALDVSWWQANSPNVYQLKGWKLMDGIGGISCADFPPMFSLYTRNGSVASLGRTPAEAIRKGYLEVVWSLKRWDGRGGIGTASETSPRKLLSDEDAFGAPILPQLGSRRFVWAKNLFVVPWKGKPRHMVLENALSVLKTGHWGVVLFPLPDGHALAERLIEYPPTSPRQVVSQPLPPSCPRLPWFD